MQQEFVLLNILSFNMVRSALSVTHNLVLKAVLTLCIFVLAQEQH